MYPSAKDLLYETYTTYVSMSLFGALVVYILYGRYITLVMYLYSKGFSEHEVFCFVIAIPNIITYIMTNFFSMAILKSRFLRTKFRRMPNQMALTEPTLLIFFEGIIFQLVHMPLLAYGFYPLFKLFGLPELTAPLPSFPRLVVGFLVSKILRDVVFDLIHRTMHHPFFFSWLHKPHHDDTAALQIGSTEIARPFELVWTHAGCSMFFGCHGSYLVFLVWLSICNIQSYEGHCGYSFHGTPLHFIGLMQSDAALYHDFHHAVVDGNFGSTWTDYLYGTMAGWAELKGPSEYVKFGRKGN